MKPVLTPGQMSDADRSTIESGTSSLELMERAGSAVARAAVRLAGGTYGRRFLVVCGKGNNGGDGFVAARKLLVAGGFPVVVTLSDAGQLSDDALNNYQRISSIRRLPYERESLARELGRADIVVDAIFGTGFRGKTEGQAAEVIDAINRSNKPVLSIDIPSGIDGERGAAQGPAIEATVTVTLAALKTGLVIPPGSIHAGRVEIADIGIADNLMLSAVALTEGSDVASLLQRRSRTAHKRSVGTVLVVSGSVGMSGAAALVAMGALRAGAGLVTVATPASVAVAIDQRVLEGTVLPLPETGSGTIESSAVTTVLERARTMDVVALGPGLSTDPETVEFTNKLVTELDQPLVIDADGLNALAGNLELLAGRESSHPVLITPHPGEMGRLLGRSTREVQEDRINAALEAARISKAAALLKGFGTIIASPAGEVRINPTGGPALATGGSGDVLTGICATILAFTRDPFVAGWAGAWIHGRAGDLLAQSKGERGIVASDVAAFIPEVLREGELQWQ